MSLAKLNRIPTAKTPLGTLTLLRAEYEKDNPRRMPFVRDRKVKGRRAGGRHFWCPAEAFPDCPPGEQGTLCAGTYLQYVAEAGPKLGCMLGMIFSAMPAVHTQCEIHFLDLVESYAFTAARLSPSITHHMQRILTAQHASDEEYAKDHRNGDILTPLANALKRTTYSMVTG